MMTRPRIAAAGLLAAGALALAAGALAKDTPSAATRDGHTATIATDEGDSAWVKVDRGPRLHIVTKDARHAEPRVVDIDLSDIGRVVADAMREVSRSLDSLHVETVGPKGDERLIIDANGKETVIDLGQIMRDVDREVSRAMREVDRDLERGRGHRHVTVVPPAVSDEDRRGMAEERAQLRAEMDALRSEMSKLRDEIGKLREQEQRRD